MKKILFLSVLFVFGFAAAVTAFDLMETVKSAAVEGAKDAAEDAIEGAAKEKPAPQEAAESTKSEEPAPESETDAERSSQGGESEPAPAKQGSKTVKRATPAASAKRDTVKDKNLAWDEIIYMEFYDDSNIVNFKRDGKTLATWVYNEDGTVEKKGETINGTVEGRRSEEKNYTIWYASATMKIKGNEIADGRVVWKGGDKVMLDEGYKNGKRFGPCTEYYHSSGDKRMTVNYSEAGVQEGVRTIYYDGMVDIKQKEIEVKNGKNVHYKEYYENGKIKEEGGYDNEDNRDGVSTAYSEDGAVAGTILYKKGKVIGVGTAEKPLDTEAYRKIEEFNSLVVKAGLVKSDKIEITARGGMCASTFEIPEAQVGIYYSRDKNDIKETEEYIKTGMSVMGMANMFSGKKAQEVMNFYQKDGALINVVFNSKKAVAGVEKILKNALPGMKKR